MNKCFRAIVRGHVQGVAFRMYTQRMASSLDLKGWVMNRADGSVEVYAEGGDSEIESMIDYLHFGPPAAEVEAVEIEWLEATSGYSGFNIRY